MQYQLGKFDGKILLGEMEDPHKGRTLRAYYIGSDTLVGVNDGVDSWIASVEYSCHKLHLARRIAEMKDGRLPSAPTRRRLIEDEEPEIRLWTPARRRIHVE